MIKSGMSQNWAKPFYGDAQLIVVYLLKDLLDAFFHPHSMLWDRREF